MRTEILPADSPGNLQSAVEAAVVWLQSDSPVALPTETVYGLAANALKNEAVVKIFEAKDRPLYDPLIVHLPSVDWVGRVANIPKDSEDLAHRLMEKFWPGPLTFVLPRQKHIPDLVTAGQDTVALRISAHPVFRAISEKFNHPLAAPSANRFGKVSPTTATHVFSELDGRIPLIVNGGSCTHGIESTIIAIHENTI
ncbi:MAG: L-threonylcarbamoyladenylate synthase, partial [Chthoniobacterales bacterium]